jgi:hypothetical protein
MPIHPILDLCGRIRAHDDWKDLPFLPPAESVAEWFLEHFNLKPPLSLDDVEALLSEALGWEVRRKSVPAGRRALNAVKRFGDDLSAIIYCADGETREAAKMTILHEVAKIMLRQMLHDRPQWGAFSENGESWSNLFASHVLAPESQFRERMDWRNRDPVALAIDFGMSLPAILTRMAREPDWNGNFFGIIYASYRGQGGDLKLNVYWKTAGKLTGELAESDEVKRLARQVFFDDEDLLGIPAPQSLRHICDVRLWPPDDRPNRAVVVGFPLLAVSRKSPTS